MKPSIVLIAAAASAVAAFAASPALAQSSVGFSISVGNRGYYSPYYGGSYSRYLPFYDDYGYSRAAQRACRRDPYCSGYGYRSAYPYYAAPVYAPPVVTYRQTYEARDNYDPLPRWRAIAPQSGPYQDQADGAYDQPYTVDLYEQPIAQQPNAGAAGAPPVSPEGAVRYDLAQRGYVASDFTNSGSYDAPQFQAYPDSGAAQSYISGAEDPNDVLLGGPR